MVIAGEVSSGHTVTCLATGAPLATRCHRAKHEAALPGTSNVGHTSGPSSQSGGEEKDTGTLGRTARTKPRGDATARKWHRSGGCEGMAKGFLWQQVGPCLQLFVDL